MLLMGLAAIGAVASAQEASSTTQETKPPTATQKGERQMTKQEAREVLGMAEDEFRELSAKSREVSTKIGELALKGDIKTKEDVEDLKKLIDLLQDVNQRLAALEEFMATVKGWIEGQSEALPIMADSINSLLKIKDGVYVQFQYRDSNQPGSRQHSFNLRRIRMGGTWVIDSATEAKVSFDLATGTSQLAAELKDAILTWKMLRSETTAGTNMIAGQFSMPLGYEIARSSSAREFPERARYNTQMFNGERVRGVMFEHGLDENTTVFAGLMNALSIKDSEQSSIAPGPGGRMAGFAGINWTTPNSALGFSYMNGKRPETAGGAPEITRQYMYVHGEYIGLIDPNLWIRGEGMQGRDRIPGTLTAAQDMNGYHVILGYNISNRNQIFAKFSDFDPNTDTDNNSYKEYGIGYRYYINPGAMITTTFEVVENQASGQVRYNVLVTRLQLKF
jgi:hypothetical protein